MKKLNILDCNVKKVLGLIFLLCPLVSACAKSSQNTDSMVESQNNMTEMEHRIANLEQRVATIDSNVQESNSRVYDVHNKSGRPTGMTARPKPAPATAQTPPVAYVSPMSDAKNAPTAAPMPNQINPVGQTPVSQPVAAKAPMGQVGQPPVTQAPAAYAPNPSPTPVIKSSGPVASSVVSPDTSSGVLIKKKDAAPTATASRAPMGTLAQPSSSTSLSLPPESAMYPPAQTAPMQANPIQTQAQPVQTAVATPIMPVVNTNTQVNQPPVAQPMPTSPPVTQAKPARAVSGEQAAYKAALDLVLAGKFDQGITLFNNFLQQYPNGRLAPNAYYWIGESQYAKQNYPDALLSFKQVSTAYPKHHKTADALLKAGMTYEKLGDLENARLQYQALMSDFPSSNAAKVARNKNI